MPDGDREERRLDVAGAVALAGVASAHGQAVVHKAEEAPYVAALFGGLIVAATLLAAVLAGGRATSRAWGLAGGLALGALAGYVASRTLGLPQLADHVGHWLDPAALVALACEAAVVALWVVRARRLRLAARRASVLALPEPVVAWRAVAGAAGAALALVGGGGAVQDALAGGRVGAHAAGGHDHAAGHAHAEGALLAAAHVAAEGAGHAHEEEASGHAHDDGGRRPADRAAHAHEAGQDAGHAHEGGRERARRGGARRTEHAHARRAARPAGRARAGHRHAAARREGRVAAAAPAHRHGPAPGAAHAHGELLVTATGTITTARPPLDLGAATAQQRADARALLRASHAAAARQFPDVAAARRRGYVMPRSAARATLVHLNHAGRTADGDVLDPERPESLVYLRRPGRPLRLVAFMFRTRTGRPPTPSPLVRWHVHGWCADAGAPRRGGPSVAHPSCGAGQVLHHGATMMFHLWLTDELPSALALDVPAAALRGRAPAPPAPRAPAARPSAPRADRVVRVLAGDAVALERLGTARLAGVRAPAAGEPCAQAAQAALEDLLAPGAAVEAVWEAPREDAEGRVLVSLRAGGADVAVRLVRAGLAVPASDPVGRHAARLERSAARARAAGLGVWAAGAPACP